MKIEKTRQFDLIRTFYKGTGEQNEVIKGMQKELREVVTSECSLAKLTLSQPEQDSESVFALLAAMEDCFADEGLDLVDRFKLHLRRLLRGYIRKPSRDLESVSITDPSPDPLETYITKEQIWLIKQFLKKEAKPKVVEQFFRHYMDGTSFHHIALEDGENEHVIATKLKRLFRMVQKYIVRINNV